MPWQRLSTPSVILALAFGLAACGGGGESDEDKIVETIETSVASTDPSACTELQTLKFTEQTQAEEGKAAVKECEKEATDESDKPDSVKISKVAVDGSEATADVAFVGSTFDGQTLGVALIEEDGDWKLAEATGFSKFDKTKFIAGIEAGFEEESVEPKLASCLAEFFEAADQSEIEGVLLGGSEKGFVEAFEACQG